MPTPAEILASSGCYLCLDAWTLTVLGLQRTSDWLASLAPAEDVTPTGLTAQSGCFACLTPGDLLVIKVRLLVDIAAAQGGVTSTAPEDLLAASGCWACLPATQLHVIQVVSTPNPLDETIHETIAKVGWFIAIPHITAAAIEVLMLSKVLLALDAGADVTPEGIMGRAGCFSCLEGHNLKTLAAYLTSLIE